MRVSRRPLRTAQRHIKGITHSLHGRVIKPALTRSEGKKEPSSPRAISTSLLRTSPCFQIWPINLVVFQGSYSLKGMGELISRPASRLDAFSGYPIRT